LRSVELNRDHGRPAALAAAEARLADRQLRYDATSEGFAELAAAAATVSGDAAAALEARKAAAVAASPRLSAQLADAQTLEAALAARVNDPAYRKMLTERDRLRALRDQLGADVVAAKATIGGACGEIQLS
jgi:uncharacterized protein involved in exopolysaccharide biosynthesis